MVLPANKGLSAFAIKVIMVVFMIMDHLVVFFPNIFPIWFRYYGRIVAPTFAYLMTVALCHTRNRAKYISRLTAAGLVMFAGNLAMMHFWRGTNLELNIFFALAVSAALIDRAESLFKQRQWYMICINIALVAGLIYVAQFVEGGYIIPIMSAVFYFLRKDVFIMCAAYIAIAAAVAWHLNFMTYQHYQAFAVIPILLYSGKKGGDGQFSKWFFYIVYPLHIWAMYLVQYFMFFHGR